MSDTPTAYTLMRRDAWSGKADLCALDYDSRFIRRKTLTTESGTCFLVNLAQTTSINDGDALELDTGALIEVRAAPEPLLKVMGTNLPQLAWHIGNRHTPCQIAGDHLLIQRDPVIRHMLEHLSAQVEEVDAPFTPEGGAYGHGRTHSHAHGHTAHDHSHDHSHAN